MGRWLKRIGITLVLLIAIVVVVGLFLPTTYMVERSIIINADREKIHEHVADLEKWDQWTPWSEADPSTVITRGQQTKGVGASQSWVGSEGDGSLTLTMASPQEGIEYDLFFEGGAMQAVSSMLYGAAGEGTTVTWTMSGGMDTPVIGGYFAVLMDAWVGPMFDRGLEKLKAVVESG